MPPKRGSLTVSGGKRGSASRKLHSNTPAGREIVRVLESLDHSPVVVDTMYAHIKPEFTASLEDGSCNQCTLTRKEFLVDECRVDVHISQTLMQLLLLQHLMGHYPNDDMEEKERRTEKVGMLVEAAKAKTLHYETEVEVVGEDEEIANEMQIAEYSKEEVDEPNKETEGLFVDEKLN